MFDLVENVALNRVNLFIKYIFPFVLVGLLGNSISFLRFLFNVNSRWVFVLIILIFMLLRKYLLQYLDLPFFFVLFLYIFWCVSTSFWSDVSQLSFIKGIVLLFTIIPMLFYGVTWVVTQQWKKSLDYLWILSCVIFFSGFTTKFSISSILSPDSFYSDSIKNANMFGCFQAMIFPYFIWNAYKKNSIKKQFFWLSGAICCVMFVMLSMSRASMLMCFFTFLGFIINIKLTKKIFLLITIFMLVLGATIINSNVFNRAFDICHAYLFKSVYVGEHRARMSDIFSTRRGPWDQSMIGAKEGGLVGIGYGVSYNGGDDFNLNYSRLSSVGYGREKGNSQLAIIEETGIIGFILYVMLIVIVLYKLIKIYFMSFTTEQKMLVGIIGGLFLGILVQSGFEAWWDSPGAPEFLYTWILIGVIRGLEIDFSFRKNINGLLRAHI